MSFGFACLRGNSYFNSFAGFWADNQRSHLESLPPRTCADNLMKLLLTFARVKSPSALLPSQINKLPFVGHEMVEEKKHLPVQLSVWIMLR